MRLIFETTDYLEASIIEGFIVSEEVPYVKKGGHLNSLLGGVPMEDTLIQIYIPESEYERMKDLLFNTLD